MSHTESTLNTTTAAAGAHARGEAVREVAVTEDGRVLHDPTHRELPGHGNTPGGWLMAALVVVGFLAGCIGLFIDAWVIVWIGVAMIVAGALVGFVAAKQAGRSGGHARH